MDILEKITKLRLERGWSIYKLADEAGLTQSTVSNMFSIKTTPSISTLSQICDAFGLTLSQFFNEDEGVDANEQYVLSMYKKLNTKNKNAVKNLIKNLLD